MVASTSGRLGIVETENQFVVSWIFGTEVIPVCCDIDGKIVRSGMPLKYKSEAKARAAMKYIQKALDSNADKASAEEKT